MKLRRVKERYAKVDLMGDSCCDPLSSDDAEEGCCSGNNTSARSAIIVNLTSPISGNIILVDA